MVTARLRAQEGCVSVANLCSEYWGISEELDEECMNTCEGNATQVCGGALKISVYRLSDASTTTKMDMPKLFLIVGAISAASV